MKLFAALAITLSLSFSMFAHAFIGNSSGGGGEPLEIRVNEIRSDILSWILKGGAKGLRLPELITYEDYLLKMSEMLQPQRVAIAFVDTPLTINNIPKTCIGFIIEETNSFNIHCHRELFAKASESDQYVLLHHEYAGLAGLERNLGANSDYRISAQLTGFLTAQVTLKLAIAKPQPSKPQTSKFDPFAKLEEGQLLYHDIRNLITGNDADLTNLKIDLDKYRNHLADIPTSSARLRRLFAAYSNDFEREANKNIQSLSLTYVTEAKQDLDSRLDQLETNVNRYISAEQCQACDPQLREEALSKYKHAIATNVVEMREIKQATHTRIDVEFWKQHMLTAVRCNFDEFFFWEESDRFSKLKSDIGADYHATLGAGEIISGKFRSTLDFLAEKAPLKIVGQTSALGKASSSFNGGRVIMKVTYDYDPITGYDNISHPREQNSIYLIHQYLSLP